LLWLLWFRAGLLGGQVSLEESVRLVHYARCEAALPEKAPPLLAEVDPARVGHVGLPHRPGQPRLAGGHENQVHAWPGVALAKPSDSASGRSASEDATGAVRPDGHPATARPVSQQAQIRPIVPVAEERLLTTVPALDHMMGPPRRHDASDPTHTASLPRTPGISASLRPAHALSSQK